MNCFMFIGLPSSGKTTLRKLFFPSVAVISSDEYIEQQASIEGRTYNDVFSKYIKKAEKYFWDDIENYQSMRVVVDRTNTSSRGRKKLIRCLSRYKVHGIFVDTPLEVALERNAKRTGKVIPEHIIRNMDSTLKAEPPSLSEGFTTLSKISLDF